MHDYFSPYSFSSSRAVTWHNISLPTTACHEYKLHKTARLGYICICYSTVVKELIPQWYMMNARNMMSLVCQEDTCFKVNLILNGIEDGTVTQGHRDPGAESIQRCHLTSIGNAIVEIRRSYDRLISTMRFPILVRWHLYIESWPWPSKRWTNWENGAVSYILLNRFFDYLLSNKMTSWCMYLQMLYAKCVLILKYTSCVRDIAYMLWYFCRHDNFTVYIVNILGDFFCPALAAAANSNSK